MFSRIEDFRHVWTEEIADTLKVMEAIPDSALNQAVTAEHRDLRRLAWHLVTSIIELPAQLGLKVEGPKLKENGSVDAEAPDTIAEIRRAYRRAAESLLEQVEDWTAADLQKKDTMFGHLVWTRGQSLFALVVHQCHHRGQMTVLMRQAGLAIPEFYGPTKETWAGMGMAAPAV